MSEVHDALTSGDPAAEPVSLEDMKNFLKVESDDTDDDTLINTLIKAARQLVEVELNKTLIQTTQTYKLDRFPNIIYLPKPPVSSVTSIAYVDPDGNSQTFAASKYQTDLSSDRPRIEPAWGEVWPDTRDDLLAVTVTYVAGYGSAASDVPDCVLTAVKMIVADMYEYREAQGPEVLHDNRTAMALLSTERHIHIV